MYRSRKNESAQRKQQTRNLWTRPTMPSPPSSRSSTSTPSVPSQCQDDDDDNEQESTEYPELELPRDELQIEDLSDGDMIDDTNIEILKPDQYEEPSSDQDETGSQLPSRSSSTSSNSSRNIITALQSMNCSPDDRSPVLKPCLSKRRETISNLAPSKRSYSESFDYSDDSAEGYTRASVYPIRGRRRIRRRIDGTVRSSPFTSDGGTPSRLSGINTSRSASIVSGHITQDGSPAPQDFSLGHESMDVD
ncbi:MAG: hypothetical protein M1834_007972 [Cirrosporium novae-zelandiae]|nr:MAG: hypothetical protein M1834_007972 [Cirrosporium novae-zelandiae]